jgi:uncharacterized protein
VKRLAQSVAVLVMCVYAVSVVAATDLGVITGGENGTYYQFGQDLRKLVRPAGINLVVHPSKGAVDNIFAVSQNRGVQLGIVQSDVLTFVADQRSNPALSRIATSIRMVFPLFDEEVHVLGRRDIGSFEQLAGKRVAVGREGSGTNLTARWLVKLAGVVPGEMVPIDGGEALAHLKAGRIDAMIYVAGYPIALLRDDVTAEHGLTLIPVTHHTIAETYRPTEIPASTYPWQPAAVSTVSVKAVLVSFDFRGPECEAIGRFAQQIAMGMDWLTRHGHPKWKRVDLDYVLQGWEQYDCVRKHVAKPSPDGGSPAASPGERNPIADAIKDALDKR